MKRLTLADFRMRSDEFDRAVAISGEASHFCSGSIWQIAAHDHLHRIAGEEQHFIVEDSGNWLAFVERDQPGVYFPFESAWMFGCPLIGKADASINLLARSSREWLRKPTGFCISGVPVGGELHTKLRRLEPVARRFQEFPTTDCMILDLHDEAEGWLSRRSRKFRRSLHLAEEVSGIEVAAIGNETPDQLYRRILEIQKQTSKWREGTDILQYPEYAAFYRALLEVLHQRGQLRLLFASYGGKEVAYIFGGVTGNTYRGLQMGYIEEVRSLGLGNRLQLENLKRCATEGVTRYDLGMHAPYKERWADRREVNTGVFLIL